MLSHMYRGTPDRPGLVLGLDNGGACHGIAFRVADADWAGTTRYLNAREQVTNMYHELVKPVRIVGEAERKVPALFYAVNRAHRQYAGRLSLEDQLHHVRQGHGQSGSCADYVMNTVHHLREEGIRDHPLEKLVHALMKL